VIVREIEFAYGSLVREVSGRSQVLMTTERDIDTVDIVLIPAYFNETATSRVKICSALGNAKYKKAI